MISFLGGFKLLGVQIVTRNRLALNIWENSTIFWKVSSFRKNQRQNKIVEGKV
jgi:hypothetical protein